MNPVTIGDKLGDTTHTKVFVGGLAWETQKDTMKKYFVQFGEILEAVVITDKSTGRSKGYGFVTFKEPDAAMKACADPSPVIDGRRANCNLASLGLQRSKPSTPKQAGGRNMKAMGSNYHMGYGGGMVTAFPTAAAATFPQYSIQQGVPFANVYGYSAYSPDYAYHPGYYGVYGVGSAQYPTFGVSGGGEAGARGNSVIGSATSSPFYPYVQQLGDGCGAAASTYNTSLGQSYGLPYHPHQLYQYSAALSHPFGPSIPLSSGTPMKSATLRAVGYLRYMMVPRRELLLQQSYILRSLSSKKSREWAEYQVWESFGTLVKFGSSRSTKQSPYPDVYPSSISNTSINDHVKYPPIRSCQTPDPDIAQQS
ncbi:hypothetical protein V2J09_016371 [Rumex salicifolius]